MRKSILYFTILTITFLLNAKLLLAGEDFPLFTKLKKSVLSTDQWIQQMYNRSAVIFIGKFLEERWENSGLVFQKYQVIRNFKQEVKDGEALIPQMVCFSSGFDYDCSSSGNIFSPKKNALYMIFLDKKKDRRLLANFSPDEELALANDKKILWGSFIRSSSEDIESFRFPIPDEFLEKIDSYEAFQREISKDKDYENIYKPILNALELLSQQ